MADSLCTRKKNCLCMLKYVKSNNVICRLFVNNANDECGIAAMAIVLRVGLLMSINI